MRHKKRFQEKIWKCSKGAISILLAVLLLPFYSLAAVLVEAGRYQNSVKALDTALGSSAISTLAEYESYLQERFGLLAVRQTDDAELINDEVNRYLSLQNTVDVRGVDVSKVEAQGVYPLSDVDILKQQVLDSASVMAPAKFAVEVAEIDNIISQLEKGLGISKIADQLSAGASLVSSEADLFSELESADKKLDGVKKKKEEYDSKYTEFSDKVNALISHLATDKPDPAQDAAGASDWDSTAEKLREEATDAQEAYQEAIQDAIDELQDLHDNMAGVVEKATAMAAQTASFANATGAAALDPEEGASDSEKTAYKNITAVNSSLTSAAKDVSDVVSTVTDTFTDDSFRQAISDLQKELDETKKLDMNSITGTSSELNSSTYHATDLSKFTNSEAMKTLLTEINAGIEDDSKTGSLFALFDLLTEMFSTELIWDGRLNSRLNLDYYQSAYGGLPSSKSAPADPSFVAQDEERAKEYLAAIDPEYNPDDPFGYDSTGMSKMERFIQTLQNFVNSLSSIQSSSSLFDKMKACANTMAYGADLCLQMSGLGTLMVNALESFAQREVLMGYLAYNMPNRTNFTSGTTLTGYSFSNIALAPTADKSNAPLYGGTLPQQVNYCFNGAELEYIMFGNASESYNQTMAFVYLWGTRIILDLAPVLTNTELQQMLSSLQGVPYVGPILWLIGEITAILFEPLLDCYVLVNGESVPLYKTKVYLSPSGIFDLVEVISEIAITDSKKADLTKKAQKWSGVEVEEKSSSTTTTTTDTKKPLIDFSEWGEEILALDYTEHLLILMSLAGSNDTYLKRLADLIQCEMTQRNLVGNATIQQQVSGKYYDFNIDEAYTALRVHATGSTVQVLPVPSLSTNSMFHFDRVIYRGY